MLEIFAVVMLCINNSKLAKQRGRSGGGAIAYTIGLWIGMEFFGAILAALLFGDFWVVYLFALMFAAIGGVISWLISKNGAVAAQKTTVLYKLTSPCTINLIRDYSFEDQHSKYYFTLNNAFLEPLDNDSMLTVYTNQSYNTISVTVENESRIRDSYSFEAVAGANIEIHNMAGKFMPHLTKTEYPDTYNQPDSSEGVYCSQCGKKNSINRKFCNNCGSKLSI